MLFTSHPFSNISASKLNASCGASDQSDSAAGAGGPAPGQAAGTRAGPQVALQAGRKPPQDGSSPQPVPCYTQPWHPPAKSTPEMVKKLFVSVDCAPKRQQGATWTLPIAAYGEQLEGRRRAKAPMLRQHRGWEIRSSSDLLGNAETVRNIHALESRIPLIFPAQFGTGTTSVLAASGAKPRAFQPAPHRPWQGGGCSSQPYTQRCRGSPWAVCHTSRAGK